MRGGDQARYFQGLLKSAAQHILAATGLNEGAHKRSSAISRGDEHNIHAAYKNDYCDGFNKHHTYYRGEGGYGYYNSDGDYTGVKLDHYGYDSCGYNDYEANYVYNVYYHGNDGYGTNNSKGDYVCANINNYNDGSCGYRSYEEEYGCYYYANGGNHCENEYGRYYNEYVGATTDGYETTYPPPTEKKKRCAA